MLSVLGIPFDENSSFLKGSAKAPQKIIEAFYSDSSNAFSEIGFNCRDTKKIKIIDEVKLSSGDLAIEEAEVSAQPQSTVVFAENFRKFTESVNFATKTQTLITVA